MVGVDAQLHKAMQRCNLLVAELSHHHLLASSAERTDPAAFTESWATVKAADGILVPGGFGDRGVEGKIAAISHARTSKVSQPAGARRTDRSRLQHCWRVAPLAHGAPQNALLLHGFPCCCRRRSWASAWACSAQ